MIHNWSRLLYLATKNTNGKALDGSDGNWEGALYQLIAETYKQPVDIQDESVMCVLIALHEAIQGKSDLMELAEACVQFSRTAQRRNPELFR